jgi:hypothetical protein
MVCLIYNSVAKDMQTAWFKPLLDSRPSKLYTEIQYPGEWVSNSFPLHILSVKMYVETCWEFDRHCGFHEACTHISLNS